MKNGKVAYSCGFIGSPSRRRLNSYAITDHADDSTMEGFIQRIVNKIPVAR
jgi:hypothetical protein